MVKRFTILLFLLTCCAPYYGSAQERPIDYTWEDSIVSSVEDGTVELYNNVFITFDLDALDPSIMPSTGTPEPGGMLWYETLDFLRQVFKERNVVGFDIVELCPQPEEKSSDFLAAKLYYKMLSYKFEGVTSEQIFESNFTEPKKPLTKFNIQDNDA